MHCDAYSIDKLVQFVVLCTVLTFKKLIVTGKWLQLVSGDSNFLYAAVAVMDNFMYVCGGMGKPAHARSSCLRYEFREKKS